MTFEHSMMIAALVSVVKNNPLEKTEINAWLDCLSGLDYIKAQTSVIKLLRADDSRITPEKIKSVCAGR